MCCNWINYLIFPLFRFSFSPWITRTQDFSWVVSWLCCLFPSYFLLLLLHLFLPCFPSPSVLCVPWRRPKTASTVELYYNQDLTCYYQNDSRFTCTMATVDSKGLPHDAPSVTLTIRLLMAGKVLSINFLAFALFFFFYIFDPIFLSCANLVLLMYHVFMYFFFMTPNVWVFYGVSLSLCPWSRQKVTQHLVGFLRFPGHTRALLTLRCPGFASIELDGLLLF